MKRLWIVATALACACGGGTESVDPSTAPVEGTYSLVSQGLAPGAPSVITHDGTIFNTDVYVLAGGTYTRSYTATNVPVGGGARTQFSGTVNGAYERSGRTITLHQPGGAPNLTAGFTGNGMNIIEGDYVLTYSLR